VRQADLIVLAGGHVPTQNAFFQRIRLRELLKTYDGVVLGISAGSMNMADVVYAQPEEPGESVPSFQRFAQGLGLVNVSILPHYQKARHYMLDGKRLYEDITFADSMGHTFFALPDGSYFFQDEDGLLLCGRAFRIQNSILELLTIDEEVMDMEKLI
jgi:dipeptidase E